MRACTRPRIMRKRARTRPYALVRARLVRHGICDEKRPKTRGEGDPYDVPHLTHKNLRIRTSCNKGRFCDACDGRDARHSLTSITSVSGIIHHVFYRKKLGTCGRMGGCAASCAVRSISISERSSFSVNLHSGEGYSANSISVASSMSKCAAICLYELPACMHCRMIEYRATQHGL